jgi:hypothetical protein
MLRGGEPSWVRGILIHAHPGTQAISKTRARTLRKEVSNEDPGKEEMRTQRATFRLTRK